MWTQLYNEFLDLLFYLPFGGEGRFRRKCVNFACPTGGEKILDICCGTGVFTFMIARHVTSDGQIIGVDFCESALKVAKNGVSNLPVAFLIADAENLPFASARFDKCLISFGLHHMPQRTRQNTLREVHRTLKSTGSLFAVDYNLPDKVLARLGAKALVKLDTSDHAYEMLVSHSLLAEIEQAGFQVRRRELIGKGMIQLVEARHKS
jgi:demethylmenaquinone methyltransferase/2-methoxy-6-polyprenyl-1,4-benzoquinol methylase